MPGRLDVLPSRRAATISCPDVRGGAATSGRDQAADYLRIEGCHIVREANSSSKNPIA